MRHLARIAAWAGILTICPEGWAQDSTFYRVVSTQSTRILSLSVPPSVLTWTNSHTPSDCSVEICHNLSETWWPVTYPIATNPITTHPIPTNRTYRLGFTPFPYGASSNSAAMTAIFSNVYDVIARDSDIICHHFDDGIPWPEALSNQPYHANFEWDISHRVARTPTNHMVYLALTPINFSRNGMALYRGENGHMPLPTPWDSYTFDHPNVKTAFVNHCNRMIDTFQPAYLALGIEVNLLMEHAPADWDAYMDLHRHAYSAITNAHPDLPVFVSLTGMDLVEGYTSTNHSNHIVALQDVMPYSDLYGLSLHCFISSLMAEIVPPRDLLRDIMSLSSKPVAVCETSYPAEAFSINFNGVNMLFNGSPDKQRKYIENLISVLDERDSRFIINFVAIDYDDLWDWMGQPDDIHKLWRDTGLYDGNRIARPALRTWKGKLFLPVAER